MPYWRQHVTSFLAVLVLSSTAAIATEVPAGYNVSAAAQVMVNLASHSWEWGTAAEALLELYNPELSVFASNPFPGGKVPQAGPSIVALEYAKSFIDIHGQVFVADSAVGDPSSLGVSAILIGQSDSAYINASNRQADYILNQAPRWSNGAISQRPDVAEIWADNMAMSFPFLAYLAVQNANASLMSETVTQCGLHRDVLKTNQFDNWQHIIGPQSQDTGLWSTGNGWAAYGMVRVLHTLQRWPGSSSMTAQAGQLKSWIKEILDGAMLSGLDDGLLHNYLNDANWFGEISGTALLSAAAYRMAVNDPGMFPQTYVSWADANRAALARHQDANGVFSPAVNPYSWLNRTELTSGSPEGQAFTVYLYTAYRDCVGAGVCAAPNSTTSTIPTVTFTTMPAPTGATCGSPQSCDANGCDGGFAGLVKYPVCQSGLLKGCECLPTNNTCGPAHSCDLNGCAGAFDGLAEFAQCTGNFVGCDCTATSNTCGPRQSCDLNRCAGAFAGSEPFAQCTGNFVGCECSATPNTCGSPQSCDLNGCAGAFNGQVPFPQCTGNFVGCPCAATSNTCGPPQSCDLNGCEGQFDLANGKAFCTRNFIGCECTATANTCGAPQSCDLDNCAGAFAGSVPFPQCINFFKGCQCSATDNTCGPPQSCGLNGCAGAFDLSNGLAFCTGNFVGCECQANPGTCGAPQSCDLDNCDGAFEGSVPSPVCTNFFEGCQCSPTSNTCGPPQSCDLNSCNGGFDSQGVARCQGNFVGCECVATSTTCGTKQSCDLNGCDGAFVGETSQPTCQGSFKGCVCTATSNTCGPPQSCTLDGCNGAFNGQGQAVCMGNFFGCPCQPPPGWSPPGSTTSQAPPTQTLPPLEDPWYCVGLYEEDDCNSLGGCTHTFGFGARDMTHGTQETAGLTGIGVTLSGICGTSINGATVECSGNINTQCSGYGVATYAGRTCRTQCLSRGDPNFCWDIFDGDFTTTLAENLICDRALS